MFGTEELCSRDACVSAGKKNSPSMGDRSLAKELCHRYILSHQGVKEGDAKGLM